MQALNSLNHQLLLKRILFQTLLLTSLSNRILSPSPMQPGFEGLVPAVNARAEEVTVNNIGITITVNRNLKKNILSFLRREGS